MTFRPSEQPHRRTDQTGTPMATRQNPAPPARQRRARGSITPQEVIRGAFELCELESVDGLSMPRLAQHLDVGVTSIYWYFKSKEDLLDALTEHAFTRFYGQMPPLKGHEWDDVLRQFFTNFRSILRNDDVLCDLAIMRGGRYSDETVTLTFTRIEEILQVLVDAGFTSESATYAYFTLSVYTRGALFVERNLTATGFQNTGSSPRAPLAAGMPVLSSEISKHSWYMVSEDDFEFGIENTLRGLRELLAADRRAAGLAAESPAPGST
jgi:AcrR family transcriptional regulator